MLADFNPRTRTGYDALRAVSAQWLFYFNPRTRTGYDYDGDRLVKPPVNFNPRTRTGYDGVPAACIVISGQFQSTYPHGVRPVVSVTTGLDGRFQSTYPHGVRPETGVDDTTNGDFNPRTRTGYDKIVRKPGTGVYISIHVPARGTTHKNANQTNGHDINFNPRTRTGYDTTPTATPSRTSDFNPRTRTGYDNRQGCEAGDPVYFNPRTRTGYDHSGSTPTVTFLFQSTYPHGVRQLVQAQLAAARDISIHVPARGTTSIACSMTVIVINFNPRTRTGYDNRQGCEAGDPVYFNPRTRTGYDHSGSTPTVTFLFQSTYPHGVRQLVQAQLAALVTFQSTYPHGVRLSAPEGCGHSIYFNPRTARGTTPTPPRFTSGMPSFQSTYPHGVRPNLLASLVRCSHFNPRTRTGYDEKACNAAWTEYISIHVPARGTTRPAS